MDENTLQSNLDTIKEMVLDEQKLVTYVSVSKDLCVHVNDSKKLLSRFLEDFRKKEPDAKLNVSYIISGLSKDNKARTTVVSEKDINEIRNTLKIVFFEHIYSVGKGLPAVDNVALLAISRLEDLSLCTGLIKSNSCVKHSIDEISNLKSSSQVTVQSEQKPPPKIKDESKNASKKDEATTSVSKIKETKSEPSIKTELPSPIKEHSSAKTKSESKKNGVKTQKGIAGFFNKCNSAPSKVLSKEIKQEKKEINVKKEKDDVNKSAKDDKMDVDEEVTQPKKEVKEKETKSITKKEQVNGKAKNKGNEKLTQIKKNAKVDKKRKRLLHVSDSEDEDEKDPFIDESEPQDHNISDDEIPPTPAVNTVKITSGIVNPKKRRKIIDKTYTDDEGFILTKKVEVYESCSDNEEEVAKENVQAPVVNQPQVKQETSPKSKKNGPKNSKKKISPPQKGKQSTMMNFFQKK